MWSPACPWDTHCRVRPRPLSGAGAQTRFPECSAREGFLHRAGVWRWLEPELGDGSNKTGAWVVTASLQVAGGGGGSEILLPQLTTPILRRPKNKWPSLGMARTAPKLWPGKKKNKTESQQSGPLRGFVLCDSKKPFVFHFLPHLAPRTSPVALTLRDTLGLAPALCFLCLPGWRAVAGPRPESLLERSKNSFRRSGLGSSRTRIWQSASPKVRKWLWS